MMFFIGECILLLAVVYLAAILLERTLNLTMGLFHYLTRRRK